MEILALNKPGVYCIKNTLNGKRYIGSSTLGVRSRLLSHLSMLRREGHNNRHLQGAWSQYGERAFNVGVLMYCQPTEVLIYEQIFMNVTAAAKTGYNFSPTAGNNLGCKNPNRKPASEETRRKISESKKGQVAWNKGKEWSAESRRKMSMSHRGSISWNKGLKATEEARCNQSKAHMGHIPWNKGNKGLQVAWNKGKKGILVSWNKGNKTPEEIKQKISESLKGNIPWNKGKNLSVKHRQALSEAHKGHKPSEETRRKLSEAQKKRWEAIRRDHSNISIEDNYNG